MKRLLCLVLCLMLALPAALAETADTLPKRFNRQLTGGNGIRGYVNITASGVAEWLNVLLPFTATQIQVRAIGQKQGDMSETVLDDDDWQVRFYAEDSADREVGTTWLYGNPQGVFLQSELLPGTLLTLPVEQVNLLYQLMRGDYEELFFAFDPLEMKQPGANGNVSAYEAVARLLGIPAEEWESDWLPVVEKYFLHLDLWLTGYGDPTFITGESGGLTMSATYRIPVADLKAEAKYVIGMMLYDNDLQNLLLPYVSMEQRVTYLNPKMVYFYEKCIDDLPLSGDIIFSREMSALGEIVAATVSLPLPSLPDTLTAPVGEAAAALFQLPYTDLLDGVERVEFSQKGTEKSLRLTGRKRTVTISANVTKPDENTAAFDGGVSILPAAGAAETAVEATLKGSMSHRIWQDEKYLDHETSALSLAIEANPEKMGGGFQPVHLDFKVDYRNNPNQPDSAVQVNYNLDALLPDAEVQAEAVLRITPKLSMVTLPTTGAENVKTMTEARKTELIDTLVSNAVKTMASLGGAPVEAAPNATEAPAATMVPEAEPTSVPPMEE